MDKLLSIIIPSYNMEKYLSKCLGSLLIEDQELFQKLDVIVVNDGSKDRTSEIAHGFEAKYPGVFRVVDKPNGHYGSCINAGLSVALGTFVKVLDADDSFETANLSQFLSAVCQVEASALGQVDALITDFQWVDEQDRTCATTTYRFPVAEIVPLSDERVGLDCLIYMHALAYRTENLRKIGYRQTEGVCFTDNEWIFEPFCFVRNLYYLPVSVYRYLNGREGQSTDKSIARRQVWMFDKVLSSLARRYARWQGTVPPKVRDYWWMIAQDMAQYVYQMEIQCLHSPEADARLKETDGALREYWPELGEKAGQFLFTRKLPIKYVSLWRRTFSSQTVQMKLFVMLARIVHLWCHPKRR